MDNQGLEHTREELKQRGTGGPASSPSSTLSPIPGRPRLQPDMASSPEAAGTAAHPQTFPSSGHPGCWEGLATEV